MDRIGRELPRAANDAASRHFGGFPIVLVPSTHSTKSVRSGSRLE